MHPINEIKKSIPKGAKVVFVSGTFNILHPGHLRLLRFAKECGNFLVVGVLSHRASSQIYLSDETRLEAIREITLVDKAFILSDLPEFIISVLKPDVVVKGKEHSSCINEEELVLNKYGGKLLFSSGESTFSSLELIKNEIQSINSSSIQVPLDYINRHRLNLDVLLAYFDKIKNLKIAVVGDLILDEYIQCDPLGMSQEDPTIVVTPVDNNLFLGGAGIVAAHAKSLGARSVSFFSVVGGDENSAVAKRMLEKYGVDAHLILDESRPTTLKQRFRANNKTLLRVNHLRQHSVCSAIQDELIGLVKDSATEFDLLIFSDFNYGVLSNESIKLISEYCSSMGIPYSSDSQCSSQVGNITKFKKSLLVSPTEHEARVSTVDYESGLVVLANKILVETDAMNVFVTLGAEGMLIHKPSGIDGCCHTDRIAALNASPMDVAGAGDCVLICSSMLLCCGSSIWESAYIGMIAAGCQVGRVGNIPMSYEVIEKELRGQFERVSDFYRY